MKRIIVSLVIACILLSGCRPDGPGKKTSGGFDGKDLIPVPAEWDGVKRAGITYQILVYSFADSDGDGRGDFNGIKSKLDYLDRLGVSALWLSPVHPSISYHSYDVNDYTKVNPQYGTEEDFNELVKEAHKHGIRIYLDYVLNHCSVENAWFREAKSSEDNEYRDWFAFSKDPQADILAGKIPQIATEQSSGYVPKEWRYDEASGYYWHCQFGNNRYADFNFGPVEDAASSPAFEAICRTADGWIDRGVDGFRIDAAKHIYHNTESDENPRFLKAFYDRVNRHYHEAGNENDIYIIGEVLSKANKVAQYYAGLPAFFEFSFWYSLRDAINSSAGNRFVEDIQNLRKLYEPYRTDYIAATKLTNHDENRAGSELGEDIRKMKLASAVLLTSSGHPYLYHGEELGYLGETKNGDEYVRQPMKWTRNGDVAAKKLGGKVDWSLLTPEISVEVQSEDKNSILNVYRQFAAVRNTYPALARGEMTVHPKYNSGSGQKEAAVWYMGENGEKDMLVVHNFSEKSLIFAFDESLDRPVALQGVAKFDRKTGKLMVGAWSSVVFDLK
ncbi:MAG: alpha-amylase family glycosyl hydrolase [Candidatus Cryptobacteroides sp.]